jgi:hypothetical protein
MLTTKNRCSRRRTVLAMMMIQKSNALTSQLIDIGCFVVSAAVTSQVGESQIISKDQNDIRPGSIEGESSKKNQADDATINDESKRPVCFLRMVYP